MTCLPAYTSACMQACAQLRMQGVHAVHAFLRGVQYCMCPPGSQPAWCPNANSQVTAAKCDTLSTLCAVQHCRHAELSGRYNKLSDEFAHSQEQVSQLSETITRLYDGTEATESATK